MIIVTHPTTFFIVSRSCFSGTHCKGVSKQLCVQKRVFGSNAYQIAPGCIFLFRNSFQYPQSNRYSKRVSKRLSRVVAFTIDLSVSRVRVARNALSLRSCIAQLHPKHNAFKGVSKQLCVDHLYRNVFLAQTRIRSHLAVFSSLETRFNTHNQIAIRNAFRNAFLELLRLPSISQYREYEWPGMLCHCGAALRNFIRNTMHLKWRFKTTLRLSPLQKRVSGSIAYQIALFSAFQKGVSNPIIKTALRFIICKNHPESRLETLILHQKKR